MVVVHVQHHDSCQAPTAPRYGQDEYNEKAKKKKKKSSMTLL
jgi:hypothetical protein